MVMQRKFVKMARKWKSRMWYYTKKEAEQVASGLRREGKKTKITRSKNLNQPEGGKHIYNVWYK